MIGDDDDTKDDTSKTDPATGAADLGSSKTSASGHPPGDENWDYVLDKPKDQNSGV